MSAPSQVKRASIAPPSGHGAVIVNAAAAVPGACELAAPTSGGRPGATVGGVVVVVVIAARCSSVGGSSCRPSFESQLATSPAPTTTATAKTGRANVTAAQRRGSGARPQGRDTLIPCLND
jgi:hypothetical protein